jgi:hypothetical protein
MPVTTGEWLGSAYAGWTGTALWFLVGTDIEGYPIPPAGTAYALVISALDYWKVTLEPNSEACGSVFVNRYGPPLKADVIPAMWDGTAWHLIGTHEAPAHAIRIFNGVIPFYTTIEPLPYYLVHGSLFWTLYPPAVRTRSGTFIYAIPLLDHPSRPPFPSAEDIQDVRLLTVPTRWKLENRGFILENPYGFSLIGDGGWLYRSVHGTTYVAGTIYFYLRVDPRSFEVPETSDFWYVTLPFTRSQLSHYDGVLTEDGWLLCYGECLLGSQALIVNRVRLGFTGGISQRAFPWPMKEQETKWVPVRALCIGSFKPPRHLRLRVALLFPEVQWVEFQVEDEGCAIYKRTPTPDGSRLIYRTGFARPIANGYVPSISSPWLAHLRSLVAEIHSKARFVLYHHGFMQRILMAEVDPNTNDALYCSFRTVPHSGDDPAEYVHEIIMKRVGRYQYRNGQPFGYIGTIVAGFADSRFFSEATILSGINPREFPELWWNFFLYHFDYRGMPRRQFPTFVGYRIQNRHMLAADALDSFFYQEIARTAMRTIVTDVVVELANGATYLDPTLGYEYDVDPWVLELYYANTMTLEGQLHQIEPSSVWYELRHRLRVSDYPGRRSDLFECSLRVDTPLGPEFLRTEIPQPAFGEGNENPSAAKFDGTSVDYYQDWPHPEWWYLAHPYALSEYFPVTFPNRREVPSDKGIRLIFGQLSYRRHGGPDKPLSPPYIFFPYGFVYSRGEIYRIITNPDIGNLLWSRLRIYWDPFPSSKAVRVEFGSRNDAEVYDAWHIAEEKKPNDLYGIDWYGRRGWHGGHAAPAPTATFGIAYSFHPIVEFRGTCPIPLVFAPPFRELFERVGTVLVLNSHSSWEAAAVFAGVAKDRLELSPMYWYLGAWRYRGSQFFTDNFPPDGRIPVPGPFVLVGSDYFRPDYVVGTNFDGDWWQMPLSFSTLYLPPFRPIAANRLLFFHQGWQQTLPAGRLKRLPDPFEAFLRTGSYNGLDYEVTGVRHIMTMGHARVRLLPRHAVWEGIRIVPYFRIDGGECPLWQGEPILAVDGFPLDDGRVYVWVYTVYGVYSLIVTPSGVEDWSFDPLPRFLHAFVGRE